VASTSCLISQREIKRRFWIGASRQAGHQQGEGMHFCIKEASRLAFSHCCKISLKPSELSIFSKAGSNSWQRGKRRLQLSVAFEPGPEPSMKRPCGWAA